MDLRTCKLCPHATRKQMIGHCMTWCKKAEKVCIKVEACPLLGEEKERKV